MAPVDETITTHVRGMILQEPGETLQLSLPYTRSNGRYQLGRLKLDLDLVICIAREAMPLL